MADSKTLRHEAGRRLAAVIRGDDAAVRARLASLRHGIGKDPGEDPVLWGLIFADLPEVMLGQCGKPSKEEWAIYAALTLYALHQQGADPKEDNMNVTGISLGKAALELVMKEGGDEDSRDRVSRRFNQIALADDVRTLAYYLRTFIPLLRLNGIRLDYVKLSEDLYWYQSENGKKRVRLEWGQDYYRNYSETEEEE